MATSGLAPAILEYVEHGTYPDSEVVVASELSSSDLTGLLDGLRETQESVKDDIRKLSKTAAPDIDTWISRAKQLQADIQQSRETARAIVAEAEAGRDLRAKVEDASKKAELLGKEVSFNEALADTLEHISNANDLLQRTKDAVVKGDLDSAQTLLKDAQTSISGISGAESALVFSIVRDQTKQLRQSIQEMAVQYWNQLIQISLDERKLTIWTARDIQNGANIDGISVNLPSTVQALQSLDCFHSVTQKFARDFELAILKPRLNIDADGRVGKVMIEDNEITCVAKCDEADDRIMFRDVMEILEFIHSRSPEPVSSAVAAELGPNLISRLEDIWFEPAVPLEISELPLFHELLDGITLLAQRFAEYKWKGAERLHDWVDSAPKTWITKRREAALGEARNCVFAGISATHTVERIETQQLAKDDALLSTTEEQDTQEGNDDWDTAWDEPTDDAEAAPKVPASQEDDDEDASAWDIQDEEVSEIDRGEDNDEGEAWGWGDEPTPNDEPAATKKATPMDAADSAPKERELTLRETFTVTSVPDGILSIIQKIIVDAEELANADYEESPIAVAMPALYTLPTLALAIYRATAPTVYGKLPIGNMLMYNDATHLGSKLRDWQASQSPSSRLRLDNDVKALETFARRAYSAELDAQRTILRDLLDGAQGFTNSSVAPFKQESESAIDQVVHRLREVHRQWKDVLSHSALLQSIGAILASVTSKMILEIEEISDIGEADSHQLTALIQRVFEVKDLFQQAQPASGTDGGEMADMTFVYCPNWLKFQYLAEILESSLVDIKFLWNEGELSLEYDADEIVELIEALFAESDVRRKTIAEIRRGGRR